jgi:hypothetical protein
MKKLLLFLICLSFWHNGKTQSVSYLTTEYTEILSYSIEFTYYYETYKPYSPYVSNANILATLQARYDRNYSIISKEWGKLLNLELINVTNKATLKNHKEVISSEIKAKCNGDLGNQDYANYWIEYVTQTFRVPSIKDEIKLLQKCDAEINRIKYEDPNNYPNSKRYKSISKVLKELESCPTNNIKNLNWESYEIQEEEKVKAIKNGYVNSSTLNVRTGPSSNSSVITTLKKGDIVEIIEIVNSNWSKIEFSYYDSYSKTRSNLMGYVYNSNISFSNGWIVSEENKKILDMLGH